MKKNLLVLTLVTTLFSLTTMGQSASGDFKHKPGNVVRATSVISMNIDGKLDDAGWVIDQPVSKLISGTPVIDSNIVFFGLAYNAQYLYVGLDLTDATLTLSEMGEVFIDGNKNGGAYDEFDLHMRFVGLNLFVLHPDTITGIILMPSVKPLGDGVTVELAIPWSELGITPTENEQIGFDLIVGDSDTGIGIDYLMAWNGDLTNYESTSLFGDMIFGVSSGLGDMMDKSDQVALFPNPSDGAVSLQFSGESFNGNVNILITDITGRIINDEKYYTGTDNIIRLDAGLFTPGMYFVAILSKAGGKAFKKLIIK